MADPDFPVFPLAGEGAGDAVGVEVVLNLLVSGGDELKRLAFESTSRVLGFPWIVADFFLREKWLHTLFSGLKNLELEEAWAAALGFV